MARVMTGSGAVAFLVLLLAATRARVIATNVLQRIAYRFVAVIAMRAMNVMMVMVVIVVAVGTVYVGFLTHLSTTPE
jgi:hypothetical protein